MHEEGDPPWDYEPDYQVHPSLLARMGVILAWTMGSVPRSAIDEVPVKRGRPGKPPLDDHLTYAEKDAQWLRLGDRFSRDEADTAAITYGLRLAACEAPDAIVEGVTALRKRRRQGR